MSGYSRVNIHAYSEAQLQDVAVAMGLFADRDVVVTEVNQLAPSFYAPKLESLGCHESYFFILSGDGAENKQYHLMGSGYYADFKALAQGIGQSPPLDSTRPVPGAPHDETEGGDMLEFKWGFLDLAILLGTAIVGLPEMDEASLPIGDGRVYTFQTTTTGRMEYVTGGQPKFYRADNLPLA